MNRLNSAKMNRLNFGYLAELAEFKSANLVELAEFKTTIYILEKIIYVTVDHLRNLRRPYFVFIFVENYE